MASLSDMLLQQNMRNPRPSAAQTILLLISMLAEAGFKAWAGRRSAYKKLSADLADWRIFSKDNPYAPVGDRLRPKNPVLNVLSRIQPICFATPASQELALAEGKLTPRARAVYAARRVHFHNKYSYVKRLLRKEGISFKVSQGFWNGFICVQASDLERARQVLADAGIDVPVLMGEVPHTVDAGAYGMSGDELARRLAEIGFDACAHEQEVIVTFDKGHDPVLLATVLAELAQEGEAQDAAAEQARENAQARGGREREREAPVKGAEGTRGRSHGDPMTVRQRKLVDSLLADSLVPAELKDELRTLKTTGEVTDYLNAHRGELGVEELDRKYGAGKPAQDGHHANLDAVERAHGEAEQKTAAARGDEADKTAVNEKPVEAPEK